MQIRNFQLQDIQDIIEILTLNGQYGMPAVDGPDAMQRLHACPAGVFLVCEGVGRVVGLVRGTYDGSRAMIHLLSVHPAYQRQGIGSQLVQEISKCFRARGAPTVSATVTDQSLLFWESVGFTKTKAFVVGNW
jgi:ribosomal protein S18 acetylase RimI-like enzyme